jgi:hypothetical protein
MSIQAIVYYITNGNDAVHNGDIEENWIPTVPGKNWFAYFRFYQPTEAYFDRSWPLPDFEPV